MALPKSIRHSQLYRNLVDATLQYLIEQVGGVEGVYHTEAALPDNFLARRTAGNAVEILGTGDLVIMHTTSTYPAAYNELNLKAIHSLKERYGVPIGYSGHETGIPSSVAAAVMSCPRDQSSHTGSRATTSTITFVSTRIIVRIAWPRSLRSARRNARSIRGSSKRCNNGLMGALSLRRLGNLRGRVHECGHAAPRSARLVRSAAAAPAGAARP